MRALARPKNTNKRYEALIPALALLAPYFNLLTSDNYSLFTPEVLIVGGIIALFGLGVGALILKGGVRLSSFLVALFIIMFFDFQLYAYWATHYIQHVIINLLSVAMLTWLITRFKDIAGKVFLVMFLVINLSTLAAAGFTTEKKPEIAKDFADEGKENLPVFIHIILDEFAGMPALQNVESLDQGKVDEIFQTFLDEGFNLYPGAYSQFFKSNVSLGHAFNLKTSVDQNLVETIRATRFLDLSQNAYFSYLKNKGYRLHIYTSEFISFCPGAENNDGACVKYKYKDLSLLRNFPLSTSDRAVVIGNIYLSFLNYYSWFKEITRIVLSFASDDSENIDNVVGYQALVFRFPFPLTAFGPLQQLQNDLETAKPGDAFFLHLLVPHFPYILSADCQPLPLSEWVLDRSSGNPYKGNSNLTREFRYQRYLEQVVCTKVKILQLLDQLEALGLKDKSIIILHGDHGSRIVRIDPLYSELEKLQPSDFQDSFSTFLAVKLPGDDGGIHDFDISLGAAFLSLVDNDFQALPKEEELPDNNIVYMENLLGGTYSPVAYPPAGHEKNE